MDIINDITTMAIEELIDNAFKQIDIEAIEDLQAQKEKVLGWIDKIPPKDVLIIAKIDGKIKVIIQPSSKLTFKSKPTIIDLQDIVEKKIQQLTK